MRISKPWKKVWKVTGIVLGVLLILQLIATFFLGPVLASRLSERIEEASYGVYKISNRSANLNLMNGSLTIKDFEIKVDTARQAAIGSKNTASYQLKAPRIRMKGMEVYSAFRSKKLDISTIEIDQPEVEFTAGKPDPSKAIDSLNPSTLYDLTKGNLTQLNIGKLQIKEGSFTYLPMPGKGQDVFEAKDIFLLIRNFRLDSASRIFSDRSFFAEEIELGADVRDYSLISADSLYKIKIGKIGVATHRSELMAGAISIQPLLQKVARPGDTLAHAMAAITLPRLRLEGINLHDLYFGRKVKLDALRLFNPELTLVRSENPQDLFESRNPLGLDVLERQIKPWFQDFQIAEIEITHARVNQKEKWEDTASFASIKGMSVSLRNFRLDSLSRNKLLRADDIILEIEKYDLELIQETYRISGRNLWLSTQSRFLLTDSLRLIPGPRAYEAARRGKAGGPPPDVFELSLPSLAIEGVDANQAYFERRLDVNKIYLGGPQLRLTNYPQVEREQVSALAKSDFYDLISAQLKSLVINDLEVDEGRFLFNTDNDANQHAFSVKDISVQVSNFRLDSTTRQKANLPFYADDINVNINVEGYSFTLPDSIHQVTIGDIGVSTKDSIIFASSIRFSPTTKAYLKPDSVRRNLYDLFIPRFELQGLNVLELYLDKALHVDGVQLQEPLLRMHSYAGNKEAADFDIQHAYELIAPSLNALSVGRLTIEGGTFHHTRHKGKQLSDFSIPDVWMMLESFSLDSTSRMGSDNFLFAKAIEARIRGFHKLLGDSVHSLSVRELGLSSASKEVYLDGIQLLPTEDSSLWQKVPSLFQAFVPHIRVQGLDPYQLYIDRDLHVDSIMLNTPSLELVNYPVVNKEKLDSLAQSDLYGLISGYLRSLEVGNLRVEKGSLRVKDERITSGDDFVAKEVAIQIKKFRLDSLARKQDNNPFYAEDIAINLNIDQYKLMLPDSSYQLQAGKIGFSSGGSTIFIDSLSLIPEKVQGQAARIFIPQLQLEGINLRQLYLHRQVELAALRMLRPQMSLRERLPEFHHIKKGQRMVNFLNPDIFAHFKPYLSFVNIASVEIYNGWAGCRLHSGKSFTLPDINLHLEDFLLDEWSHQRLWRYLFAKDISLQLNNFRHQINDMYDFRVRKFNISSCYDSLSIDSLKLIPRYGMYEYGEKLGYSTDRVDLSMAKIVFKGMDLWHLLVDQRIEAQQLSVKGISCDVFRDRRYPDTVIVKKIMPQAWLRKFPAYIRIDTALVENGDVTYGEHIEGADKAGFFHVQNIRSKIFPITNDSVLLAQNIVSELISQATLMKSGHLKANFRVPLADTLDKFSLAGVLGAWDLKELNVITEPAAFLSIKSGQVQKVTFNMTADKNEAKGRMRCYYTDLRISVLNRKSGNLKNVQSFFANSFLVRDNNPPLNKSFLRAGRIAAENDPNRSIFNYWYRSMRSGISSSISIKGERDRIKDFLKNFEVD